MLTRTLMLVISLAASLPSPAQAEPQRDSSTRLVLLGTAGGPSAKRARAQPASAVIVGDDIYIVDAGDGVVRQLTLAGFSVADVRAVFITHHHSDHVADYGTLLLRSWMTGRTDPIETFGPAPIERMTRDYLDFMRWDLKLRVGAEGRQPLDDMIDAHDIDADGAIYVDENVKVTAFSVNHGAAAPAFGFRFDTADKSIVFSGDTTPEESVIAAAKGADILVHEVINVAAVDAMVERVSPGNNDLRRHIVGNHTSTDEVGKVATAAGVHMLVLTHFGGTGDPEFDRPEVWEAAVRTNWAGNLIVGEDLMIIE